MTDMADKLSLNASPAVRAYARLTERPSREVTRLLRRAAAVLETDAPDLNDADRAIVLDLLRDLALLREESDDGLPSPQRLAAELHDVGRADLAARVADWPLSAVWALEDERLGGAITLSAQAGPHAPVGRPRKLS